MIEEGLVLGIETSCDETAAAVVRGDGTVLSSVVASQDSFHAHFGGVVPEIASRRHTEVITAVVEQALRESCAGPDALDLIAVTHGPGLIGSLVVGVAAAKAYSLAWSLPVVPVNHVEAHLHAAFLHSPGEDPPVRPEYPAVCLVVSGGHTDLIAVHGPGDYQLLGCTRDDAAGEALDKAARLLGLGYPGGPAIQQAADGGRPDAVPLPRPVVQGYDFSFAGLKTALARLVEEHPPASPADVADFAASFQQGVVEVLWATTYRAVADLRPRQLIVAGGVAANRRLREVFAAGAEKCGVRLAIPPPHFCTDNAAMVALCGIEVYRRTGPVAPDFDVFSALPSPGDPGEKV